MLGMWDDETSSVRLLEVQGTSTSENDGHRKGARFVHELHKARTFSQTMSFRPKMQEVRQTASFVAPCRCWKLATNPHQKRITCHREVKCEACQDVTSLTNEGELSSPSHNMPGQGDRP